MRIAVGAKPSDVVRMVLGQGMSLTLVSVLCGIAGAAALTRFMTSMLFGVSALDPFTYAVAVFSLVAAAALASWIPARRAATIDPLVALRAD